MIRLLKAGVRTGLVAVAIAAAVPMIAHAQTTEPAIERAPAAAKAAVGNTSPKGRGSGTDNDTSAQTPPPVRPAIPAVVEVEIRSRFNELRRELLDDRADAIDWWLAATAMFLTLLGIVAVVAGYLSFRRLQEIEGEARNNMKASKEHAEGAQKLAEEIKAMRDQASSRLREINAQFAADAPEKAKQVVADIRGNPEASLIDKAIAQAVSLQQQGKRKDAIEKWRAVAHVAEGSDNELAARAWFSVGYLAGDKSPEECISANDRAIHLKPDLAAAYYNRGKAKGMLGRHDEAIADYDQAIHLKPDLDVAYNNRGTTKKALGRHDEAIADYDQAIHLKPDYAEAYNNRGNAKRALERHDEAIADYDEAIRLKSDYAEAYNNRGNAKRALERHDEAIADYDEAIRLKPDLAEPYNNRGNAKAMLGRYDEAIADYDKAVRLKTDFAAAYNNRGKAKAVLGLKDEARKDFETALELAQKAGNANIVAQAEQSLRGLDADGGR